MTYYREGAGGFREAAGFPDRIAAVAIAAI